MRFTGLAAAALVIMTAGGTGLPRAQAGEAQAAVVGPSGLPLPRFVSLKSGKVNMRVGPGRDYSVDWTYMRPGLPIEIIQEYDNWRRIRDAEGTEGWVFQSLLSGKRTAVAAPWQAGSDGMLALRSKPGADSKRVASIEPGAQGEVMSCTGDWCRVNFSGHKGWMEQAQLWGVYPGEKIED
ncbi:MAG: SH3 domain-containing protein [Notoacmeibacter sp.]|nr:SH3 domain-containing protein [Notoacmeibacter sp.]MCC0032278.1 SH3 domain-containing protein [Brucellaceae bacterium]